MQTEKKMKLKKILEFIDNLVGDNVSAYAAQASFFLVISAIPFFMLVFTILKFFINIDVTSIIHWINSFAPAQISIFITTILNELFSKTSSASIISVTAVSSLWLSSKGIMALYTGLSNVYNINNRNYLINRLLSIVYTLIFVLAIILTIVVFGFGSRIEYFVNKHSVVLSAILNILLKIKIIIFLIYLTFVFMLFYKFMAIKVNTFKSQFPGAVFSAVGWIIFSYMYSIYIENFSNYSYVYGSLAAIVFLMLWLYMCMIILLCGAQINKMWKNGFFKK